MPTPIKLDLHLQQRTIDEGFTQSELSMLDECALKHNYNYNNLLTKSGKFNWNFWVGTAWHTFQEHWRVSQGKIDLDMIQGNLNIPKDILRDTAFEEQYEYWEGILPTYQMAYAKHFVGEEQLKYSLIEEELSTNFMDFKLRGKLDLVSDKPRFIRDFKTTSSAWLISPNGWHFKLQFMFYCWLMSKNDPVWTAKPFDFQLDIMQKPNLKQTKKENLQQHIQRVCKDIQDQPDKYFIRETKQIFPENITHFERTVLLPKLERIALVRENPDAALSIITNPNTNACNAFGHQCDFFEICSQGWDAGKFFFEQRTTKHQELI